MEDNDIPQKLVEYFDLLSTNSRYLLSFSPFFVNHLSAYMMSYLIKVKRKRVLYICIDRPHIFIQKLLQNREVPIRSIHFMDMVLGVSKGTRNQPEVHYQKEGEVLELPMLFKLFKVDQEVSSLTLEDVDLVILDNISELRTYGDDGRVRSLLETLNSIWDRSGKGIFILHINNRPEDGVKEIAERIGMDIVDIPNETFS